MQLRSALIPLLATLCVAGAEPRRPQAPWPALRGFTSRDGLPQNSAMDLAFDQIGRLWVATQDGAAAFDGRAWRTFNLPDRQVSNFLRCVAVDGRGALWFGRQEGGLARWDGARWTLLGASALEGSTRVNALWAEQDTLWVGTHTRGLLRLQEGQITGRWLPGAEVRRIVAHGPSRWITSSAGLHRWEAGRLESVALPEGAAVGALAWDGEGRLWMASSRGLWRREGRAWIPEGLPPGWSGATAIAFTREARGRVRLWLGSPSQGLASREGAGPWETLDLRAGLPGLTVNAFLPEGDGGLARRLWVGLDEGLARVELDGWSRLTMAHGLPAPSTYGLGGDGAGTWWMGTRGGLWEWHQGQVKVAFPGLTVNAILRRGDGSVWAAVGDGLARRDGGVWRPVPLPFPKLSFRRLYEFEGDLWALGGDVGLVRLHGGRWEAWGEAQGLPVKALHSLLRTPEGLWVGTESAGLYLWREGRWIHHDQATGLPNRTVMDLREVRAADGRRWLLAATESGGLAYAELGAGDPAHLRWRVVAEATTPALPNDTVYQVQVDGRNRVYAFTNRGVARLAWEAGPDPVGRIETFTTEDGLPSLEFNGGASFKDPQGRIWGGTVAGPAVFDPEGEAPLPPPPALVFDGVTSGARALAPGAVLGHREARLEVAFAAVDLFKGGSLQYRTQLEGVEEEAGPWTPEAHRSYGSVPAGAHVLKVWARDVHGRELGPLSFPFIVKPAPWRTPWAYGAYLLGALLGAAGVHRLRTRALRRRTEALERKVAERTHEVASQRDQIAQLMGSLAGAQRDVKGWAHAAADELARSLGTGPIGVFILEGEDLRPLRGLEQEPAPSLLTLTHPPAGLQVVRVQGPSGVLQGALLLPESLGLRPQEKELLAGFASQLGAVLELQKTQVALKAARARGPVAAPEDGELRLCPLCRRAFEAPLVHCPEDGEALDDHLGLPFRVQGRYELRGLLGEGGMGLVFEAEDLRLARRVALKVLRPEQVTGQARARFLQEAHALAAIHHPGVIGVHDSGEWEGGSVFLVMERLQGLPLSAVLRAQGPGHPRQVARLVRQGVAALEAAHDAGLLHRDLKPANLFLATGEAPFRTVLLDFGLAKNLDLVSTMTQTGMVIGTPQYMSPEQTMGRDLNARSDAYGFAAVVYEALAGSRLIPHDSVGEAFLAIVRGEHARLRDLRPELGAEVDRLLEKALAPEPEDRPGVLRAWAEALAGALEALPATGPRWVLPEVPGLRGPAPEEAPTRALPGS